jgi:hypothetical protein
MLLPDNALGQGTWAFGCATAKKNPMESIETTAKCFPDRRTFLSREKGLLIGGSIEKWKFISV